MAANHEVFRNRSAALRYLQEERGVRIRKSKFYKDVGSGFPRLEADGRAISREELDRYAKTLDAPAAAANAYSKAAEELLEAKARDRKALAEQAELKLARERGDLVSLTEVEHQIAHAVTLLRASQVQFIQTRAAEMVELVSGEPKKAGELVEFLLAESRAWFHGFSKKQTFTLIYEDQPGERNA